MLGLEWTGTLSTIFEDPAVPEYESDITVIDAIDSMLFLRGRHNYPGALENCFEELGL